jgi:hypothetical protein
MNNRKETRSRYQTLLDTLLDELQGDADELVRRVQSNASNQSLRGPDAWYQNSYPAFVAHAPPETLDDLLRIIAFAYSWLATIPEARPNQAHLKAIKKAIEALRRLSDGEKHKTERRAARDALITAVQAAVGIRTEDSIVAVSKVLHFWDPGLAPMIDRNVVIGWRTLNAHATAALDIDPSSRKAGYLDYWELTDQLIKRSGERPGIRLSYRRIDELLFQLGRRATNSKKSAATEGAHAVIDGTKAHVPSGTTKLAKARNIYAQMRDSSPQMVIKAIRTGADLTRAGAQTYFYNIRKEMKRPTDGGAKTFEAKPPRRSPAR